MELKTRTLRKLHQKYLELLEVRCWREIEKISWTDRVRKEILHRVNGRWKNVQLDAKSRYIKRLLL